VRRPSNNLTPGARRAPLALPQYSHGLAFADRQHACDRADSLVLSFSQLLLAEDNVRGLGRVRGRQQASFQAQRPQHTAKAPADLSGGRLHLCVGIKAVVPIFGALA